MAEEEFRRCAERVANTRRPNVLVRGKTLTHDELLTLIINEEPFFQYGTKEEAYKVEPDRGLFDERFACGMLKHIVYRKGYEWLNGWIFSDGTIYGRYYEFKYPYYEEYIYGWKDLAKRNPFLDMVVSYTDIDETYCYDCSYPHPHERGVGCSRNCLFRVNDSIREFYEDRSLDDTFGFDLDVFIKKAHHDYYLYKFLSDIDFWLMPFDVYRDVYITLHIYDGEVTTCFGEEAQQLYQKYDRLYGDFRLMIAQCSSFYHYSEWSYKKGFPYTYCKFDYDFMRECCRKAGLTENYWDDIVVPNFLMKDIGRQKVVTKRMLFDEYDRLFCNTSLDIKEISRLSLPRSL